jgi:hypothetical protein
LCMAWVRIRKKEKDEEKKRENVKENEKGKI